MWHKSSGQWPLIVNNHSWSNSICEASSSETALHCKILNISNQTSLKSWGGIVKRKLLVLLPSSWYVSSFTVSSQSSRLIASRDGRVFAVIRSLANWTEQAQLMNFELSHWLQTIWSQRWKFQMSLKSFRFCQDFFISRFHKKLGAWFSVDKSHFQLLSR